MKQEESTQAQKGTQNPHDLLRALGQIMATSQPVQQKLQHIVGLITQHMKADRGSVYLHKRGDLALFAAHTTSGTVAAPLLRELSASKNPLTQNDLSESSIPQDDFREKGVISAVVEKGQPLSLPDIRIHQRYCLDPRIDPHSPQNEETLHAFLGVPLAQGGRILGALILQNKHRRVFSHEEVDTLQTVAMVLTEMMVAGKFMTLDVLKPGGILGDTESLTLRGIVLNGGLAKGRAVLHQPCVPIQYLVSGDTQKELQRLHTAAAKMRASLKALFSESLLLSHQESRDVMETYQLFSQDRGWLNRIQKTIESGLTAEAAIQKTLTSLRFRISQTKDAYFRDRLGDFEDLTNRLFRFLVGHHAHNNSFQEEGILVVARRLGPAELLEYEKSGIKGLLLEEGLHTAHVSILARALHLPVMSHLPDILTRVEHGDPVLLDALRGSVILNPSEEDLDQFDRREKQLEENRRRRSFLKNLPCQSLDGVSLKLALNAGAPLDLEALEESTFEEVGLYRSEIPFMMEASFPNTEAQIRLYQEVFDQAKGKLVTFRTLDIGGDKLLPYMRKPGDENPLLGWRAIRIGLDRPSLLKKQMRALLRAAEGRAFNIMFPMLTSGQEFYQAKSLWEREKARAKAQGISLGPLKLGAMVEVPAFAWALEDILPDLDFISVGSNDLFQFFYAVDRTNPHLINRYDCLSRTFLLFLQRLVVSARTFQTPISLCGEMAGSPLEAMALIGIGFRSLSLSPYRSDALKQTIRSLNVEKITHFMTHLLRGKTENLRPLLTAYALDHSVPLEND